MDGGVLDEGRHLIRPRETDTMFFFFQVFDVFCPNLKVGSQNSRARSFPSLSVRMEQELLGMASNKSECQPLGAGKPGRCHCQVPCYSEQVTLTSKI